jgi:hypothetical protein
MKFASQLVLMIARSSFIAFLFGSCVDADAATGRIVVSAGDWERTHSVVTFDLPDEARGAAQLRDAQGKFVPLQIDASGRVSFVVANLPKGQTASYELTQGKTSSSAGASGVEVIRSGGKIKTTIGGKPVLDYQAEPGELPSGVKPIFERGGYIHPVFSPSGLPVTDDFPADHRHHHGIWLPWTKTTFEGREVDFWNMGQGKGRVEFVALDQFWSGPVHGGFQARHRFVDLTSGTPKVALNERWEVRLYNVSAASKSYWVFDLVSTQECATVTPLELPKYHYGGLGLRGHGDWIGKDKQPYLTSEGETNKLKGNETRGRWCHIGGAVAGQLTGIAVLGHPENFRAPQPMRLNPSQPFFCFAPSQLGDWTIEPGKPYVSRYRFIVMDGPPDAAELDRLWNDYAHPPQVKVELSHN